MHTFNGPHLKVLNFGQSLDSCHVFSPRNLKCWNSEKPNLIPNHFWGDDRAHIVSVESTDVSTQSEEIKYCLIVVMLFEGEMCYTNDTLFIILLQCASRNNHGT